MFRSSTFTYITLILCSSNDTVSISIYIFNVSRQGFITFDGSRISNLFFALEQSIGDETVFGTYLLPVRR